MNRLGIGDWTSWKKQVRRRRKPAPLSKSVSGSKSLLHPLVWAFADIEQAGTSRRFIKELDQFLADAQDNSAQLTRMLSEWCDCPDRARTDESFAIECLAWAHALPTLVSVLPPAAWFELLERLISLATEATAIPLETKPLEHQLLAGELPWTLACMFPEIRACERFAEPARRVISSAIRELLDGEGVPHGRFVRWTSGLMASWTRAVFLGKAASRKCLTPEAELQFEWFVRQAIRFTRRDGSPVMLNQQVEPRSNELFNAALKITGDAEDRRLADLVLPPKKTKQKRTISNVELVDLPSPSVYSEWAETALMRPTWKRPDEYFALSFFDGKIEGELSSQRGLIWSGTWQTEIRVEGQRLEPQDEWHEICWFSDDDVDYIELEQEIGRGWKVQRQILFAREDRFFFFADAIIGKVPQPIEYTTVLPLVAGVKFWPNQETREGLLVSEKSLGLILPLALPEWRSEPGIGSLSQTDAGLEVSQQTNAVAMYVPLFIDLVRMKKEPTWRRLTVAQRMEIVGHDKAVGFRVQVGNEQWLIYRSLAPSANRTVLGQNLSQEFVFVQFDAQGESNPLIEVDAEE